MIKTIRKTTPWLLATVLGAAVPMAVTQAEEGQKQQPQQQQRAQQQPPQQQQMQQQQMQQQQQRQHQRQEQELSGTVTNSSTQRVRTSKGDDTNRIILLETEDGKKIAVDLGADTNLRSATIKKGTPVKVKGSVVSVRGEPMFLAETITVGNKQHTAKRGQPSQRRAPKMRDFSGTIGEMREMSVKDGDAKHQVAVLEPDKAKNRKVLVDLGPTKDLEGMQLAKGDRVQVKGIGMKISDRKVLVAQEVTKDGRSKTIERDALPNLRKAKMP